MCGEHRPQRKAISATPGSSPHVRGALNVQQTATRSIGIIPACAGSTQKSVSRFGIIRDHPRMCGEHERFFTAWGAAKGSSPHVRGALFFQLVQVLIVGIIPACAGSTLVLPWLFRCLRDHPRMCGEHSVPGISLCNHTGSSPHVRGAPTGLSAQFLHPGIIPACAGSTITLNLSTSTGRDHPRMCGEHLLPVSLLFCSPGSSPHVRGALGITQSDVADAGIIPACAGSTRTRLVPCRGNRDHPRMCGEHLIVPEISLVVSGSSPHVRGALRVRRVVVGHLGIIPACAGSTR